MHTNFKEYYQLSIEEIELIWNDSFIVFDTSVILNVYRYSESTNSVFLQVLDQFKERLWIPYQVGKEFNRKRLTVIEQQIKSYADAKRDTKSLQDLFSNKKRNPFLSNQLLTDLIELFERVVNELDENKLKYEERLLNDDLFELISNLFNKKVGFSYSDLELNEIFSEAESRFMKKIPPGFEDNEKGENKYGDFIIWKQILDKAKTEKRKIIFVTDDSKKDWWEIVAGKTLGPRIELKKEFNTVTGELFHMYNPFSFIKYATQRLNVNITSNNLTEIRELKPLNKIEPEEKVSIIMTALIKKSSERCNLDNFIESLNKTGYDFKTEEIDENNIKIFFSIPNIPDLSRRIKKRISDNIEDFGFSLVEFN